MHSTSISVYISSSQGGYEKPGYNPVFVLRPVDRDDAPLSRCRCRVHRREERERRNRGVTAPPTRKNGCERAICVPALQHGLNPAVRARPDAARARSFGCCWCPQRVPTGAWHRDTSKRRISRTQSIRKLARTP